MPNANPTARPRQPKARALELTAAMLTDLRESVTTHRITFSTSMWPSGRALRLKTGRALERRGLVWPTVSGWHPTPEGIEVVEMVERAEMEAAELALEYAEAAHARSVSRA